MAHEVKPKVFIVAETRIVEFGRNLFLDALGAPDWHTVAETDAEELIELAGKACYLSFDVSLNKNLTRANTRSNEEYIQRQLIATGHGSVLEHASVTFAFVDVSRVFTHELVRHRVGAAYSQVSGRYVRVDDLGYYVPREIAADPEARRVFETAFKQMESWAQTLAEWFELDSLTDFALKKKLTSAIRRLIGNGQANHIVATFNHRTIRHLVELRTSRAAEEEIRVAFAEVFRLVSRRYPALYRDAITTEVDGIAEVRFARSKI